MPRKMISRWNKNKRTSQTSIRQRLIWNSVYIVQQQQEQYASLVIATAYANQTYSARVNEWIKNLNQKIDLTNRTNDNSYINENGRQQNDLISRISLTTSFPFFFLVTIQTLENLSKMMVQKYRYKCWLIDKLQCVSYLPVFVNGTDWMDKRMKNTQTTFVTSSNGNISNIDPRNEEGNNAD